MSPSAPSASFEYLCYGSILILPVGGPSLYVRIWHLVMSDSHYKDDPRAEGDEMYLHLKN